MKKTGLSLKREITDRILRKICFFFVERFFFGFNLISFNLIYSYK